MELIEKDNNCLRFIANIDVSLANAIRRSVNEIKILAIDEVDIYKNDTALYDEVLAHRLGLVPLKNQKLKEGEFVELKIKTKGKGERTEVLSGGLGERAVYPDMLLGLLEDGQELEVVAKARNGYGRSHSKFSPGILFYKHLPKIKISKEGEGHHELARVYPKIFELNKDKLSVRSAAECNLDLEDFEGYEGIELNLGEELVIDIESWGQIGPKEIFIDACRALKNNIDSISKKLK